MNFEVSGEQRSQSFRSSGLAANRLMAWVLTGSPRDRTVAPDCPSGWPRPWSSGRPSPSTWSCSDRRRVGTYPILAWAGLVAAGGDHPVVGAAARPGRSNGSRGCAPRAGRPLSARRWCSLPPCSSRSRRWSRPVKVVSDGPIYHLLYFAARCVEGRPAHPSWSAPFGERWPRTCFPANGRPLVHLADGRPGGRLDPRQGGPGRRSCSSAAAGGASASARLLGGGPSAQHDRIAAGSPHRCDARCCSTPWRPNVDTIFVAGYAPLDASSGDARPDEGAGGARRWTAGALEDALEGQADRGRWCAARLLALVIAGLRRSWRAAARSRTTRCADSRRLRLRWQRRGPTGSSATPWQTGNSSISAGRPRPGTHDLGRLVRARRDEYERVLPAPG